MPTPAAQPERLRPFEHTQPPTSWVVQRVLKRPLAPTEQEYHSLCTGLTQGDELMDAFVAAARQRGEVRYYWQQLNGITQGRITQTDIPELQALLHSAAHPPFAVDEALCEQAVQFIHRQGRMATDVLRDLSLMAGYLLSAFNQTLILTGDLDKGAASRLANTSDWWLKVTDPQSNRPFAPGFLASLQVRWIHAMVRQQVQQHPQWNGQRYGLPVNQVDMAATYFGFSLVMLLGLRRFGVWVSPSDSRAVMHLWKCIAWHMGVQERWLVDTELQAVVQLRHFMFTQTPPDETTRQLAGALATEPLLRRFTSLPTLRQRWYYWMHLSSTSWLLFGSGKFRQLGLKSPFGPWLKPLQLLPRLVRYYLHSAWASARHRQALYGRAQQVQAVAELHRNPAEVKQAMHPVNAGQ